MKQNYPYNCKIGPFLKKQIFMKSKLEILKKNKNKVCSPRRSASIGIVKKYAPLLAHPPKQPKQGCKPNI